MASAKTEIDQNRIQPAKGLLSCTYAECIYKLHKLSVEKESPALPTPLVQASVVAAIFDRETLTAYEDIKRGFVP